MRKKITMLVTVVALSLAMVACGTAQTGSNPTSAVEPTKEVEATTAPTTTNTPDAEPTSEPTVKPTATDAPTPEATATPEPTATSTPAPTATPEPAATDTPTPTAAPVSSDAALDLGARVSVWGQDIGVENADGSVTFAGGTIDKCCFPLPNSIKEGDIINVVAKLKFESADDAAARFYLTDDSFNNCTVEIISIPNSGAVATEAKFTLEAAQDVSAIIFASASYGVQIQNITVCSITVSGDAVGVN